MRARHVGVMAALLLGATTIAPADPVIQIKVGGDEIALPKRVDRDLPCEPCVDAPHPGETITVSSDGSRIRRDRGPLSIVLNPDAKKLSFICQRTEVVAIEDRPLPASTFEIPADYRKIKFDRACVQFR